MPALIELVVWGNKYFEVTETAKAFAAMIQENRDEVVNKLYESHI